MEGESPGAGGVWEVVGRPRGGRESRRRGGGRCAAAGARAEVVVRGAFANGAITPDASDWSKTVCPLPSSEDFRIDSTQQSQSESPSTIL